MAHTDSPLTVADSVNGIPLRIAKALDGTTDVDFQVDDNGYLSIQDQSGTWAPARWADVITYGADPTGVTDSLTAFQNAAATGKSLLVPDGSFIVSGTISLNSNQTVYLHAGTTITQTTANVQTFIATSKDNVWIHCNGGVLVGEGTWSSGWTGNSGHNDHGIEFQGCTNSGITNPIIKDCGHAGITIRGGNRITIINPTVIGTHNLSTAIGAGDNFQIGIYLKHDPTYGSIDNLRCVGFDVSDTAQGVLVETHQTFTDETTSMYLQGIAHDIPGQHGMYVSAGGCTIDLVAENCNLDALKIQSGSSNQDLKGNQFRVNAKNCGSAAVELLTGGTGWVSGTSGQIVAHDCQRGLVCGDRIRDADVFVQAEDMSQHGVYLTGDELHNLNIRLIARNLGRYGILADPTNSDNIRFIDPIIQEPNDSDGGYDGININASGSEFQIFNPVVTDASGLMVNGIFVVAGTVEVHGRVVATGAASYGARANVALAHWPSENVTLSGTTAAFLNGSNFVKRSVTTLANDATPSVFGGGLFRTGGTTTITDFDDGAVGDTIQILADHSVTITDGAPIILNGSGNFAMVAGDTLTLTMFDDQVWQEVSRSVN